MTDLLLVVPVDATSSGTSILCARLLATLRSYASSRPDWGVRGCVASAAAELHPDEAGLEQFSTFDAAIFEAEECLRRGGHVIFVGVHPSQKLAQIQLDICSNPRTALLWERCGYSVADLPYQLTGFDRIQRVWTLNRQLIPTIRRYATSAKIAVLPMLVPPMFFRGHGDVRDGFIAIGRAAPYKNVLALAELWANEIGPASHEVLTVYGSDVLEFSSYGQSLTRIATSSPWVRRRTIGSSEVRAAHFAGARAAIFPSVEDHMPQALAEVLASGTPIIASNIPAHSGTVTDNVTGLLFELSDFPSLWGLIRRLLTDGVLSRRLSEAGRRFAREEFDPHRALKFMWSQLDVDATIFSDRVRAD